MITIHKATIEFLGTTSYDAKPMTPFEGAPVEQSGTMTTFLVTTSDESKITFGIVEWPDARHEVIGDEFLGGLNKYAQLKNKGRMSLLREYGDVWLGELRALRHNHEKGYPTLANTTVDKLDYLVKGNFIQLMNSFGAKVGTREELVNDSNPKTKNNLAFSVEPKNYEAIAVAFTVTRVLAVLYDNGLED
jgi:DUF1009 family protein